MAPRISHVTYDGGWHTAFTLVALLFSQAGLGGRLGSSTQNPTAGGSSSMET